MKFFYILLLFFLTASLRLTAQAPIAVSSPDKNLVFSFVLKNGAPVYRVTYKGTTIVGDSPLGLDLAGGWLGKNMQLRSKKQYIATDDYELLTGKTSHVHTEYREAGFDLQEKTTPFQKLTLEVRVFNDGLAFRYQFPKQSDSSKLIIRDERTFFHLEGNPAVQALLLPNYTTSHEGLYSHLPLQQLPADTLLDLPALFTFPNHIYLAITEAALTDYAGMYLSRSEDGSLVSRLSPLPAGGGVKVKAVLPHQSPWRVLLVSDRPGALIESNIITSLNEPPRTGDWSWLKPGKTTFPWWNGNVVPDTLNAPGNNFVTAQYYIDFCARNGLTYHSVVEYGLHQWYTDDGTGFQPGPHADVTKPVPGLDMKEICDYAATKGVGIRVWVHWAALYPRLDTAFAVFEKWGLKGMMVDFMDRDDQEMVNIQTEILQKAAAHHLHIQFHGAYKPTGLNRTYPNELTREGTLNYEADKWNPHGITPDHDLDIVFTRMLAGSTDYHLGGFRAVSPAHYRVQYTRPLVLGTRAHMLAMYVVLENYLQMVCDYPEAYEGQQGFSFLREVPTTWDETKVIAAEIGSYVVIARRKGSDWYLGAISNSTPHVLTLPFSFLPPGRYRLEGYTDSLSPDPNGVQKESRSITDKDNIMLHLASGGGAVLHLSKE